MGEPQLPSIPFIMSPILRYRCNECGYLLKTEPATITETQFIHPKGTEHEKTCWVLMEAKKDLKGSEKI